MVVNYKHLKQTSDKSEQAIRQLSDKLSDLLLRHTALSHSFSGASTTMIELSAKFQVWSQILNT